MAWLAKVGYSQPFSQQQRRRLESPSFAEPVLSPFVGKDRRGPSGSEFLGQFGTSPQYPWRNRGDWFSSLRR